MTSNHVFAPAMSANDEFKSQYQTSLRWAGLTAVLMTALMVWFSPRYTPAPYQLPAEAMEIVEIEPIIHIEEPPVVKAPPVLMPEIEAAPNEDPEAVATIEVPFWTPSYSPPVIDVGGSDFVASSSKPQLVSQPKPHYPEVARLARVEGTVIVKVLVDVDGSVRKAEIVRGVHTLLNNAALKAARQCVFVPGRQRELKVATWVAVPYNFRLH